jgi:tetratricopeptide (TPR) repeat protein
MPCYTAIVLRWVAILISVGWAAPLPAQETVLILPFANAARVRNLDWIGESLAGSLLDSFAAEGVNVVPAEDCDQMLREMGVRRYAPLTQASAMEIAVNLNATQVLYGEFGFTAAAAGGPSKGALRLDAQILDVKRVRRVGRFSLAGALEDLSSLQSTLAWQALRAAAPGFSATEAAFRQNRPAVRLDALESYVRGLLAQSTDQKYRLLSTAARLAPGFSHPCFQLGRLNLFTLKNYHAAADWLEKVSDSDIHYRESLFYLGLARYHTGEFAASEAALRKLAAVVPLPEVLNNLGVALLRLNDPGTAEAFARAIEADPADPDFRFNSGYALWRRGDFQGAAEAFREALKRRPDDEVATGMLGRCLQQQPYRPGDLRVESLERLKTEYNESAWLALKAMLAPKQP